MIYTDLYIYNRKTWTDQSGEGKLFQKQITCLNIP